MNEILLIKNVSKSFGRNNILKNVSFSVREGEIFFILGPSGCGKTTLLRIIAGFINPDKGKIILEGKDITELHPSKRKIGMVFQNYALWPHMTVWQNIAYGLLIRKLEKEIVNKKVEKIIGITKLENVKNLYPHQVSGGQQQRVALARALVIEPKVLLLDEPLSNLDTKLRENLRREIKRIQKETGITMIYVTHDQKEAMSLSSRIAVMSEGEIIQIDSPLNIYLKPAIILKRVVFPQPDGPRIKNISPSLTEKLTFFKILFLPKLFETFLIKSISFIIVYPFFFNNTLIFFN